MKIIDCVQGSPEWWEAKRGVPSASNFDRIITPKTGKLSASAKGYIAELIAESVQPTSEVVCTKAMMNGIETEPEARRWYEMACDLEVKQVGCCFTDDGRFEASPDGLVGEDGGLELKCPLLKTHVSYLLDGGLPDEYKCQVHGNLIVTGRSWWDFVSYAPGLPALVVKVKPDAFTDQMRCALEMFWKNLEDARLLIADL